jgi:quercetin dioxygenase-like cupin family protein
MADDRLPSPTERAFLAPGDTREERVRAIDGVEPQGTVTIRPLVVGENAMLFEVHREKGLHDPPHRHDDHESFGYLVSGRLKMVIGGEEFVAEAGSSWVHPIGVEHSSVALEDCVQISVKSPPRRTWTSDEDA